MKNGTVGKKAAQFSFIVIIMIGLCATALTANAAKKANPQFTLWIGLNWVAASTDETLVGNIFKEKYGFDIKYQFTQGDELTALNLKLAANSLPDVTVYSQDEIYRSALVKANAIMPMEKYFNMPKKYPNLAKIPKSVLKMATDTDGHIWSIPTWWAMEQDNPWPGWTADAWYVRTDILEKAGMKISDLSTLDGVKAFLKKVVAMKDSNGNSMLGLGTFAIPGERYRNCVYTPFGLDGSRAGNKIEVTKTAAGLAFNLDMANYKNAMKWYSELYREGLVDPEVVTQKEELFKEKQLSGRTALVIANAWQVGPDWDKNYNKNERKNYPTYYFQPIDDPKVPGVAKRGPMVAASPFAGFGVYVNKKVDAKKLDAILKFMDWCLEQNPIRQHELNEGPIGKYWNYTDKKNGVWAFNPTYQKERDSGDNARRAKLAPGCNALWMLASYSNKWYPWFTYTENFNPEKPLLIPTFSKQIAKFPGSSRPIHDYDMVEFPRGGVIERYGPSIRQVEIEYEARLLMVKSDDEFETTWKDYRTQLEERGRWSECKKEWKKAYEDFKALKGSF